LHLLAKKIYGYLQKKLKFDLTETRTRVLLLTNQSFNCLSNFQIQCY